MLVTWESEAFLIPSDGMAVGEIGNTDWPRRRSLACLVFSLAGPSRVDASFEVISAFPAVGVTFVANLPSGGSSDP